jgi:hypothetical protein
MIVTVESAHGSGHCGAQKCGAIASRERFSRERNGAEIVRRVQNAGRSDGLDVGL